MEKVNFKQSLCIVCNETLYMETNIAFQTPCCTFCMAEPTAGLFAFGGLPLDLQTWSFVSRMDIAIGRRNSR